MNFEYKNIVVAVDGSRASERAFEKAIEVAKRNNGKMILSHVVDTRTFSSAEAYDQTLAYRSEVYANQLLEDYRKRATSAGITNVELNIEYGSPKVKIPKDVAKQYQADLIICGATGLNAVERFLIGSVSESITRYAKCDVLVVRDKI
ncbi:universal stress protein [Aquibacillus koreensis]|uniref:Universal stress protein n=1 Tax=Aquibacillus koreensis TaxID=279446 RepID=A0A9X3WGE4_9BACI|nr:universal stress protein [Aquibacillus koreensis]MCT2534983.1 universal stress protein [Aquibacillus koreensis]MDC3419270.1 universal stress protein [Aquibacillus koreensis]